MSFLAMLAERNAQSFVVKVFEGSDFQEFRKAVKAEFGILYLLLW